MKVSIVVPIYKTEHYLKRCIESLLSQTILEKEIILVNDASPDNSIVIINEYKKKYPDLITVIDLPQNRCLGGARNAGIRASKGEFIGFVDSDDFIHPSMYEVMLEKAVNEDADIVDCDSTIVDDSGNIKTIERSNTDEQTGILDDNKRKHLILWPGRVFTKIYRRDFLISNDLFFQEEILFDENNLMPLLLVKANKLSKVHAPLYYYRQSSDSTCRTKAKKYTEGDRYFERLISSAYIKNRFLQNGIYLEYQEEVDFLVYQLYYINTLFGTYERYSSPPYHKLKELNNVKKIVPRIRSNRYFNRLDWKTKFWIKANSIHPRLFISLYSLNESINATLKKTIH